MAPAQRKLIVSNNATSTLAASVNGTTTQISVVPAEANQFPIIDASSWCPLTIYDGQGNMEIVHATNRNGGVITVIRGKEGTKPLSFPIGARVDLRLTAQAINGMANGDIPYIRLPEPLREIAATLPDNSTYKIVVSGNYFTPANAVGLPSATEGTLIHSETPNGRATQLWTELTSQKVFVRSRIGSDWKTWREVTQEPYKQPTPWELQPIGALIPIMEATGGISYPPQLSSCRYVKLTSFDSYNNGLVVSEKVEGTAPTIWASAKVNLADSPLHGRDLRMINTERAFLRPGEAGTYQDSQNLSHNHGAWTGEAGAHNHGYSRLTPGIPGGVSAKYGTDIFLNYGNVATSNVGHHTHGVGVNPSGGNEARPRNMGVTYFMRIL